MSLSCKRSACMSRRTLPNPPVKGPERSHCMCGYSARSCVQTEALRGACHAGQAHRVGTVTAICRTPWGELWTGSSRGSVRVWDIAHLLDAPSEAGELLMRELRRNGGQRPHADTVSHIICPPGGQVDPPPYSGQRDIHGPSFTMRCTCKLYQLSVPAS